jgi:hypothetical protein
VLLEALFGTAGCTARDLDPQPPAHGRITVVARTMPEFVRRLLLSPARRDRHRRQSSEAEIITAEPT